MDREEMASVKPSKMQGVVLSQMPGSPTPFNNAQMVCLEPSCPAFGGLICLLCQKKMAAHKFPERQERMNFELRRTVTMGD